MRKIYILLLAALLAGCATLPREERQSHRIRPAARSVAELRAELESIFNDPSFDNAFWGVSIRSLANGQTIYTRNEAKGFMPASNMKLYSTAVSLALLGPEYRYETSVYSADTDFQDGTVNGDLIVVGSGDPSFAARFHEGNPLIPMQEWAQALRSNGIQRVTGRIIADDDLFDDRLIAGSWSYSYLSEWYAAESSALCLNDNCYTVYVSPGDAEGSPAKIRTVPPSVYGEFVISATTSAKGTRSRIRVDRGVDTNRISVRGAIPLGSPEEKHEVTVHNPSLFFVTVLKEVLAAHGILVEGDPVDIDDLQEALPCPEELTRLASYQSPPLSEIIKTVNKPSQNLYADQLLKTLGAKFGAEGSFDQGYEVVKRFLDDQGIDSNGLIMIDGSGLGRMDLVQPRQTMGLLESMYRNPYFSEFYESLPIAGIDGTIRGRMKGTKAEGNVHAKTGYIGRVRCLSGYVTTLDGEMLAFCMMVNNYTVPTSVANRLQDRVCERLANFSRRK